MCRPHAEGWDSVHGVAKGLMRWDVFQAVIDRLVAEDCHFDHLILQWLGDPSVHERLEDMVAYASRGLRGRLGYLRFDTNGILMTPARIDKLLSGRDRAMPLLVVFTLDAVTPGTYTRVKGRDHLARVRRHIRYLLSRREALGPVDVQVQFVVQPGNAHEARAFLDYWTDTFRCYSAGGHGEILFKPLSVDGGGPGQAAADALYRATVAGFPVGTRDALTVSAWTDDPWQPPARRTACAAPWFTPVIRHDGHLVMCCADLRSELDLGHAGEMGFRALWDGPRATAVRLAHLAGRFEGACAGCGGINWYAIGPSQVESTRRRAGELGLTG